MSNNMVGQYVGFFAPSLDENKLLYKCRISWNTLVKGIESLIFKGFNIVYE
jgi:hypothetical protein